MKILDYLFGKNHKEKQGCARCGGTDYNNLTWHNKNNYGDCCIDMVRLEEKLKENSLENKMNNHFLM